MTYNPEYTRRRAAAIKAGTWNPDTKYYHKDKTKQKVTKTKKKKIVQAVPFVQPPITVVVLPYTEPTLKQRIFNLRFPYPRQP